MPAPVNMKEFLALVGQSGVVDVKVLTDYLNGKGKNLPDQPAKAAPIMVKDGIIGSFQAKHLLQGKYKGFFLGRYKIMEQIGSGGMGCVYLCEHQHMKRKAAVKVLPASLAENSSFRERFYREARAVAALNHPNIVRAFDIDTDRGLHFLAMEYVEGASLWAIINKKGPLDIMTGVHYMRQSAAGLQHAFESGLVHRDVKPGNLLVDLFGNIKVLDLGLARFVDDDKDDLSLRHDEAVMGTADYLSPEQAINSRLADTRSDVYSLGCTFYFCLTGKPPFPDGTTAKKLIMHQTTMPKPITDYRKEIPAGFVAILNKCMAKKPDERYQTPVELERALTELAMCSGDTVNKATNPTRELPAIAKRESGSRPAVKTEPASRTVAKEPASRAVAKEPASRTAATLVPQQQETSTPEPQADQRSWVQSVQGKAGKLLRSAYSSLASRLRKAKPETESDVKSESTPASTQ